MRIVVGVVGVQVICAGAAFASACGQVVGDPESVEDKLFELTDVSQFPRCTGTSAAMTCVWDFKLGSPTADRIFDALSEHMQACSTEVTPDTQVNHPDNSIGLNGDWAGYAVRISKKDKNGQAKTYVFLERRAQ